MRSVCTLTAVSHTVLGSLQVFPLLLLCVLQSFLLLQLLLGLPFLLELAEEPQVFQSLNHWQLGVGLSSLRKQCQHRVLGANAQPGVRVVPAAMTWADCLDASWPATA